VKVVETGSGARMSVGLIALLDDVAGLARMAAASLDDVIGQATKAGVKAAGVVIDDGAVTPRYVVGFAAERELPIIGKIALGSLRNKVLVLLPAALLLSLFAPWAITPLLVIGGIYLCYEGTEKAWEAMAPHAAHAHEAARMPAQHEDAAALEDAKIADAIKTDFILSAEIMAITLASMPPGSFWMRAAVLAVVGLGITLIVYGAVALIVKADDVGVHLARNASPSLGGRISRAVGRLLVRGMPVFLQFLGVVGTAAMIWVGGGIVVHGLEEYGLGAIAHAIHGASHAAAGALPILGGLVGWLVEAAGAGLVGLAVGAAAIPIAGRVVAPLMHLIRRLR
jgi:predicted DNA repair protein MutK